MEIILLGKMGFLAEEAVKRGAKVILISGPFTKNEQKNIEIHRVTSAKEMYDEVLNYEKSDIAICKCMLLQIMPQKSLPKEKIKNLKKNLP